AACWQASFPHPLVITLERGGVYQKFSPAVMDAIAEHGAVPLFTWGSWRGAIADTTFSDAAIARGDQDAYIREWATAAKKWGKRLILRFDHEQTSVRSSPGKSGATATPQIATSRCGDMSTPSSPTSARRMSSGYGARTSSSTL